MNKTATYLLYVFAATTVLAMSAPSIALALLVIVFLVDLFRKSIKASDFKKDSLWYVAVYGWKAVTRAVATSIKEIPQTKGIWDRVPYVVIGFYRIRKDVLLRILHILFAANAIIVATALAQHFLGMPALYKPLFYGNSWRMAGYTGHPNQYGGCISLILIVNVCAALYQDKRFFAYTPLLVTGLVLSGSRSYYLGVFLCFVILLALSRSYKTMLKYAAVALVVLALVAVAVPWFSNRVSDSFSLDKNVFRLNFWKISWSVFTEHPLLGIGNGMLPDRLEPYKAQGLIDNTAHAHSLYLHELAENGIPGFLLVIGVHIYFLVKYFRVYSKSSEPLLKALSLGTALSFVNFLAAGVFENNFGAAIVAMNINFVMGVLEGYRLEGKTGPST